MKSTDPEQRIEYCPPPTSVVAIVDPRAGRGIGRRVINLLQRRDWPAPVKLFMPSPARPHTFEQAVEYARDSGADRIIASGGDGTVMRVITALLKTGNPIPLSVVPTGTGNVVAGDLHLPKRVIPALRLAFDSATIHWWDVGQLEQTNEYFALRASAGHDANTLALVNKKAKAFWRSMAYVFPGAIEMMRMEPVNFTLTIDDQPPIRMQGATAFVAVTSRLSGQIGFVLSNQIRTDDGVLYAGVFHPQKLLRNMPRVIHHMALAAEEFSELVTMFPVKQRVTIDADPPQRTQIDGELLAMTPFTANVVPKSVPFVTTQQHIVKQNMRFTSAVAEEMNNNHHV
jgi:diacylglycerol kinase family enzyme